MQPMHVLSAYYRFISLLSNIVPQVHIMLSNYNLAYRRDYQTTALNALNIKRLAPYVSLYSIAAHHEWDGRRVLLLPFSEEQNELTEAIAALGPNEASKTADLYNEQQGVVLFNLETLKHELLINPHAVSYTIADLQQQLSQRLEVMTAAHPIGLRKLFHTIETSILRVLLVTVRGLLRTFGIPKDRSRGTTSTQNHDQEAAIDSLRRDIKTSTSQLQSLKHKEKLSTNHAIIISKQLAQAIRAQKACEALQQQATIKQRNAATYKCLAETEQSSLHTLRSEHDALTTKLQELAANRKLFVFWSSALAKRTCRASSSSSPSSMTKATVNFRKHILVKSLLELNALLTQVLTVLYDDTRHVHIATGMLRSLFDSESADDTIDISLSGSVLGPTLAVHPSLASRFPVVDRGGQTLLALISWRAFSDYLAVSIMTKPATYTTVWLLRFQTDPSFVSIMGLLHQFIWRRGLASRAAMSFMVAAALLILAFPTVASSMTGYTTVNKVYIEVPETGLVELSATYPGATKDTAKNVALNSTLKLKDGPLNIFPYYIHDSLKFYYNWSDVYKWDEEGTKATNILMRDRKRIVYDVAGKAFNITELKRAGNCSPVPDASTVPRLVE
ncbi:hypothetical protein IL306_014346 [Fusarium sp. DS 682]|nr:hypothetical protein IL306_014346 [Fusarium sp. DS 682]